ncbi:unnamed protein product [Anisakis simplex]|uniref:MSP domain-containing protein n=1 Tax=Anisakis simplex TaxID=6269 RepID=A0A0M3JKL0_ANISI|nr:unnamed protein product [Anisakis simplex]
MSYLDPHFRPPPAHGEFPAIRFNPNIHRYPDIPMGKLIPVTIAVSHKIMRNSPPLFHVQLKNVDSEQENELRKVLEKHFMKTDPLEHVEVT